MEGDSGSSTFKTFVCHICGRIFIRNHRLQSHIRTHNKRKLSLTSVITANAPTSQGPTEYQTKSSPKEIESVGDQSELLQNVMDCNKDFDKSTSISHMKSDSSSAEKRVEVEDESCSSSIEDSSECKSKSEGSKEKNVSFLVSEDYQSCKSLMNSKIEMLGKNGTTSVTKIQHYPTFQNVERENTEVFIKSSDVEVMVAETEITNEVGSKVAIEVKSEVSSEEATSSEGPTSQFPKKVKVSYVCEVCPRAFSNKAHYERHLLTHTKEKPHQCPLCIKSFAQVGNLNAHYRMHIEKERNNINEPEINHEANAEGFPKVRKPRIQSKETLFYSCDVCGKQFSSKCYLDRHSLTHTKEKPHICNVCFRGFAQIGNLNVHYRTHTNIKTFVCHVCDKAFSIMGSLKAHLLTHMEQKPFQCDVCSKGFSSKCFLKRHYLTHTNFKPHVCGVCHRGFVQVGNLNVHLLTHLNQHNFKCDVCDKTFVRKLYLDRHYKVHINGNGIVCAMKNGRVNSKENDIDYSMENDNAQMTMNDHVETIMNGNAQTIMNGNVQTIMNGNVQTIMNANVQTIMNSNVQAIMNGNVQMIMNGNLNDNASVC